MAFLGKSKKCYLIELALELNETVPHDSKVVNMKEIIILKVKTRMSPLVLAKIIDERIKKKS